jgi:hypothetical protein
MVGRVVGGVGILWLDLVGYLREDEWQDWFI